MEKWSRALSADNVVAGFIVVAKEVDKRIAASFHVAVGAHAQNAGGFKVNSKKRWRRRGWES